MTKKIQTAKEIRDFIKMLKATAKRRGENQSWENAEPEVNFVLGGLVVLKYLDRMDLLPAKMSLGYMTNNQTYSAVGLEKQYEFFHKEKESRKKKKNKK